MISQAFTQDCFKILSLFSLSPGSKFNRDEIKKKLRLNNVPLDNALSRLLLSKLLQKEGNYYSVNFGNNEAKTILEICKKQYRELKELPLDVYYLLLDFISGASNNREVKLILFGSYAKLVYTEKSDLDLAVLTTTGTDKGFFKKIAVKLEQDYGKNIELHFFDKKSFFKNKKDPLVRDIIKNGVELI